MALRRVPGKPLSQRAPIAYVPRGKELSESQGERRMRIGVAGIGKMGAAIAARLMEVGHDVVLWNRTPDKAKAISGATVAATPAELAKTSEAVITILTDGAAIEAVYNGPSGLLSGDVTGKLFIEMSTVPPKVETALAAEGGREGRRLRRMPGRRLDHAGTARQTARPPRRRS